jgi:hypothetical protein
MVIRSQKMMEYMTCNEQVIRSAATEWARKTGQIVEVMEDKPQFSFQVRIEEADMRDPE